MKRLLLCVALATVPALVHPVLADTPASSTAAHGRLVPALRDGKLVGLKVFAIKPGGRFAAAHLENGDLITAIDGAPVTTEAGAHALADKIIDGKADATITVQRRGQTVTLTSPKK